MKIYDKETGKFYQNIGSSIEIRYSYIHLFLYIKSQCVNIMKIDKYLVQRLLRLFSETLICQIYDNYFQVKKYKDQLVDALFSVELEFAMLWVINYIDTITIDKAKRIRELTLDNLQTYKIDNIEYVKSLKSYIRGCKLKYTYIIML